MQSFATIDQIPRKPTFPTKGILIFTLLSILAFVSSTYLSQPPPEPLRDNSLKMEKNGGKNGKHANPKARESAQQQYEKTKHEFEHWDKKAQQNAGREKTCKKTPQPGGIFAQKEGFYRGESFTEK